MEVYELLRPGRAKSKQQLLEAARTLRETHKATAHRRFHRGSGADVYEERGLFTYRFLRMQP